MRFLFKGLGFSARGFFRSIFLCFALAVNSCEFRPLTDPEEYEQEEGSGEESSDDSEEAEDTGGSVDA